MGKKAFEWDIQGEHGVSEMLPIDSLRVDHTYQRVEMNRQTLNKIIKNFDWGAFGTISVMRRPDGSNYIVDGQQRVAAARIRGDISSVPCRVYRSFGVEHEAKIFLLLNTARKAVDSVTKFFAGLMSLQQPHLDINKFLSMNFMKIDYTPTKNAEITVIDFPAWLIRTWQIDAVASQTALLLQKQICVGQTMCAEIHQGIWNLEHRGIKVAPYIEKILAAGGKLTIIRDARALTIMYGGSGDSVGKSTTAIAILNIINKGKKNKIPFLTSPSTPLSGTKQRLDTRDR